MVFLLIVGAAVVVALIAGVVYDRRYPGVKITGRGPRYRARATQRVEFGEGTRPPERAHERTPQAQQPEQPQQPQA